MKKTLILLSTILLISCGSRKSTTQTDKVDLKTETETKVKENENTKITIDKQINKETNETTEVETIEPIDATKPSYYGERRFENSRIIKRKTNVLSKDNSKINQVIENDKKIVKKERNKVDAVTKTKNKEVVSEKGNFWNWVILILLILAFSYWFYWS